MLLDKCQLYYMYRLSQERITVLEKRILKLERYTDREDPVIRWLNDLAKYRHERKKLLSLMDMIEGELANYSVKLFFHE